MPARPSRAIRTLVVDDDPAVVRLHTAAVAGLEGFEVVGTARTGAAAAELAALGGVDLVLLDVHLPDISGVEVLHRLRSSRGWAVDVLVVSSSRDVRTIRQAAAAHVVGYLAKPFSREALERRLVDYRARRVDRPEERAVALAQAEIDRLVGGGDTGVQPVVPRAADAATAQLPKGIAASTLAAVLAALDPTTPLGASAVADAVGASRATVRRYLDHLVRSGAVTATHRFGARGRPEVLYRRAAA
ncbi:response regulator [Agrococcus terreus]|uniref:response regulator n=1 Tax=Agrococcus terreus TaxID=574649 RepID=UPI001668C492|nr:response regulator [Agrococcus terreus]